MACPVVDDAMHMEILFLHCRGLRQRLPLKTTNNMMIKQARKPRLVLEARYVKVGRFPFGGCLYEGPRFVEYLFGTDGFRVTRATTREVIVSGADNSPADQGAFESVGMQCERHFASVAHIREGSLSAPGAYSQISCSSEKALAGDAVSLQRMRVCLFRSHALYQTKPLPALQERACCRAQISHRMTVGYRYYRVWFAMHAWVLVPEIWKLH